MKLFGKEIDIDTTIAFVQNAFANQDMSKYAPEENLLYQAAIDLSREVQRMKAKYETSTPPIPDGRDEMSYLHCPYCGEIVGHLDLDGEPDKHCGNCGSML
ncbi:rubrerythrin [Lachnospiraceae bacterium PF1-22]